MEAIKLCCPACLQRLRATLTIDFPSDHGLHKALDLNVLNKNRGPQIASHMFCLFMVLQQDLPMAHALSQALYRKSASPDLPDWVNQATYDSFFFSYLASLHPWLEDELTLVLRSFMLEKSLLNIQTAAPEQLFEQWFLTIFRAAMDILEAEHADHEEVPLEPFTKLLALGRDLLAGRAKLQVPAGIPMPEDLLPFCSSQCLVRLTAGPPTTE